MLLQILLMRFNAVGAVKSLNKLARLHKSQPVKLQYWPRTGPLSILGFPDASFRNNDDGSLQRSMTVFLAESGERSSSDGVTYGSLIDCKARRFNRLCSPLPWRSCIPS